MMQHSQGILSAPGLASLYYQCWSPEVSPRALILVAHGAAEHSGRYDIFARAFTTRGFAVAALDHLGHGHSDGDRCVVSSFQDYLQGLDALRLKVEAAFRGVPLFLLGHSMGGLIGANYLLENQHRFLGCVLSGPAIKVDPEPPGIQRLLVRILARLLPRWGLLQLDARGVSRVPEEVERYLEDPLNYSGKMTASMVAALFAAMNNIHNRVADIRLPLLILHGGADAMTAPEGSRFLHEHVSSVDKTLHIYPGLYHEIFNEPERDEIFATIAQWLDARTPGENFSSPPISTRV